MRILCDVEPLTASGACVLLIACGRPLNARITLLSDPKVDAGVYLQEESDVSECDDSGGEMKLVLVVRMDLKMGKGKIAAQVWLPFFP